MYGFPLSTQKASLLQGKVLDKSEFMHMDVVKHGTLDRLAGTPRARRTPAVPRARPKTIHVDSGALHAAEGMLHTKQPSSSNLAGKHFDEISPTAPKNAHGILWDLQKSVPSEAPSSTGSFGTWSTLDDQGQRRPNGKRHMQFSLSIK